MNTISAIIICCNESKHIRSCLESVQFADEIVIVDSGSTDGTVQICKAFTDNIIQTDWPGYGPQKNRALAHASSDWVLSIDADEVVSEALQEEIVNLLKRPPEHTGYTIPRRSSYLGKTIRHGDWRHDQPLRLFKRTHAQFSDDIVHEHVQVDGSLGQCQQFMHHTAFESVEEVLNKLNHYSSLGATCRHKKGQRGSLFSAITHGFWTFFRGYVLRAGFLDGQEGFLLALSNAQGCFYRYVKLSRLR